MSNTVFVLHTINSLVAIYSFQNTLLINSNLVCVYSIICCLHGKEKGQQKFSVPNILDKVKSSPVTGLAGPEGSGNLQQITRHSAHEGG